MYINDAFDKLQTAVGKPFHEFLSNDIAIEYWNKGRVGQALEAFIGLRQGNHITDFVDGEMKTNSVGTLKTTQKYCSKYGWGPKETMALRSITGVFDDMVSNSPTPFKDSGFWKKSKTLLYVPINRDAGKNNPHLWFIPGIFLLDFYWDEDIQWALGGDYDDICSTLRHQCLTQEFITNVTGKNGYLQCRLKDSKNKNGTYNPIFSKTFQRYVSKTNYSLWFRELFMKDIIDGEIPSLRVAIA